MAIASLIVVAAFLLGAVSCSICVQNLDCDGTGITGGRLQLPMVLIKAKFAPHVNHGKPCTI